jgi:hypothetical protein
MLHILKYKYLEKYKLELTFDNNTKGIVDLQEALQAGTVFEPLLDLEKFKNIKLAYGGVITWLDGKLDIAPEYLFFLANKTNPVYIPKVFEFWTRRTANKLRQRV